MRRIYHVLDGATFEKRRCNTDAGLRNFDTILHSGSFPASGNPLGAYDLNGNVSDVDRGRLHLPMDKWRDDGFRCAKTTALTQRDPV